MFGRNLRKFRQGVIIQNVQGIIDDSFDQQCDCVNGNLICPCPVKEIFTALDIVCDKGNLLRPVVIISVLSILLFPPHMIHRRGGSSDLMKHRKYFVGKERQIGTDFFRIAGDDSFIDFRFIVQALE